MDIIGCRIPNGNLRDFPLFHASSSFKNFPCASCATAANAGCGDSDTFKPKIISLKFVDIAHLMQ
jgi:hypothetical protein